MPARSLAGTVARLGYRSEQEFLAAMLERAAEECAVDVRFVVRGGTRPGVAVVGRFDDEWQDRFAQLLDQVVDRLTSWNHIGFDDAVTECAVLAERLVDRLGSTWVDEARFVGVPRGGLIVVGLLSMVMGLRRDQVGSAGDNETQALVIVDDCAFTGYRLREFIANTDSMSVACAFLRAPDELCRAVEVAESRVVGCVAAGFLRHIGPEYMGAGYGPWLDEVASAVGTAERYWVGRCEPVTFAWKEPDRFYLNGATGRPETAWHVMPRDVCIPGRDRQIGVEVVMQPTGVGPIRPADDVFWTRLDGGVAVTDVEGREVVQLDAVASAIWAALVELGNIEDVVAAVLEDFEVDEPRLRADVEDFTTSLLRRGLLIFDD